MIKRVPGSREWEKQEGIPKRMPKVVAVRLKNGSRSADRWVWFTAKGPLPAMTRYTS